MWAEISLKLMPRPYMPIILDSKLLARIVSLFLTISGEKSLFRSLGVNSCDVDPLFLHVDPPGREAIIVRA
jgi:hypothetical protein